MEICGNGVKVAAYQEPQRTRSRRKVHTRRLGDCSYGAEAAGCLPPSLERTGQVISLAGAIVRAKALDFPVDHAEIASEGGKRRCREVDIAASFKVYAWAVKAKTISELAADVGVTPATLRYYERLGMLPKPRRTASGYRDYDDGEADRIRLIKGAQRLGLRLREIRELLEVRDRGLCPCGHTETLLRRRIEEVEADLVRLTEMRDELVRMGGKVSDTGCADGDWSCAREFIRLEVKAHGDAGA